MFGPGHWWSCIGCYFVCILECSGLDIGGLALDVILYASLNAWAWTLVVLHWMGFAHLVLNAHTNSAQESTHYHHHHHHHRHGGSRRSILTSSPTCRLRGATNGPSSLHNSISSIDISCLLEASLFSLSSHTPSSREAHHSPTPRHTSYTHTHTHNTCNYVCILTIMYLFKLTQKITVKLRSLQD